MLMFFKWYCYQHVTTLSCERWGIFLRWTPRFSEKGAFLFRDGVTGRCGGQDGGEGRWEGRATQRMQDDADLFICLCPSVRVGVSACCQWVCMEKGGGVLEYFTRQPNHIRNWHMHGVLLVKIVTGSSYSLLCNLMAATLTPAVFNVVVKEPAVITVMHLHECVYYRPSSCFFYFCMYNVCI